MNMYFIMMPECNCSGIFLSVYTNFHKKLCIYAIIYKLIIEFLRRYAIMYLYTKKLIGHIKNVMVKKTLHFGIMTVIEDRGTDFGKRW